MFLSSSFQPLHRWSKMIQMRQNRKLSATGSLGSLDHRKSSAAPSLPRLRWPPSVIGLDRIDVPGRSHRRWCKPHQRPRPKVEPKQAGELKWYHIEFHMGCLQNVGSRKRSKFAFCLGPAFWRIHFSHVLVFFKIQGGLVASAFSLKLFLVWLPVLIFWSWRRLRERSETGQKHQKGSTCLASIHPSIHLISYHCYFYYYYYYFYYNYYNYNNYYYYHYYYYTYYYYSYYYYYYY